MEKDNSSTISLNSIALPIMAVFAACLIFYYAAPILIPMTIAVATAYLLMPVVEFLKRLKIPHFLAVVIVMAVLLAIGVLFVIFAVSQLASLAQELPDYQESIQGAIDTAQTWINSQLSAIPGLAIDLASLKLNTSNIANIGKILFKGIGSLTSIGFSGFLLFFMTFFILSDYDAYVRKINRIFNQTSEETQSAILAQISKQLRGFISVKVIITIGLSIIMTIGFLILGIPYAYIWGPLAGIMNLVPYIGPVIGAIPPIIVGGLSGGLTILIWVSLFIFVIQMLESNIITPRLTANTVDLNPLAVLVSSIIWGYLWGGIGVVLAVPITAAIKVLCDNVESLQPIGVLLGGTENK
jgi:predicted PurR-regulated permease PerM